MNHFLASYYDALARSDSGVLLEKDNTLYCALPSLDINAINAWIQLQKFIFPNLKVCGVYSNTDIQLLDYEFLLLDQLMFAKYDTIYNVHWLDDQEKELGYYTSPKCKLSLTSTGSLDKRDLMEKLENLDDPLVARILMNAPRLQEGKREFTTLVQSVVKQTRMV